MIPEKIDNIAGLKIDKAFDFYKVVRSDSDIIDLDITTPRSVKSGYGPFSYSLKQLESGEYLIGVKSLINNILTCGVTYTKEDIDDFLLELNFNCNVYSTIVGSLEPRLHTPFVKLFDAVSLLKLNKDKADISKFAKKTGIDYLITQLEDTIKTFEPPTSKPKVTSSLKPSYVDKRKAELSKKKEDVRMTINSKNDEKLGADVSSSTPSKEESAILTRPIDKSPLGGVSLPNSEGKSVDIKDTSNSTVNTATKAATIKNKEGKPTLAKRDKVVKQTLDTMASKRSPEYIVNLLPVNVVLKPTVILDRKTITPVDRQERGKAGKVYSLKNLINCFLRMDVLEHTAPIKEIGNVVMFITEKSIIQGGCFYNPVIEDVCIMSEQLIDIMYRMLYNATYSTPVRVPQILELLRIAKEDCGRIYLDTYSTEDKLTQWVSINTSFGVVGNAKDVASNTVSVSINNVNKDGNTYAARKMLDIEGVRIFRRLKEDGNITSSILTEQINAVGEFLPNSSELALLSKSKNADTQVTTHLKLCVLCEFEKVVEDTVVEDTVVEDTQGMETLIHTGEDRQHYLYYAYAPSPSLSHSIKNNPQPWELPPTLSPVEDVSTKGTSGVSKEVKKVERSFEEIVLDLLTKDMTVELKGEIKTESVFYSEASVEPFSITVRKGGTKIAVLRSFETFKKAFG